MRKLRIVFYSSKFYPVVEGSATAPYELATSLSKANVNIEVLTYNFDMSRKISIGKFKKVERVRNIKITRITPFILNIFNPEPFSFKLLYKFCKQALKSDIVHIFNFYHFLTLIPLIFICRIINKPIVFTPATIFECVYYLKNKKRYNLLRFILFFMRKMIKNLMVTTKNHIKLLKKLGFLKNKIYVVPCGIKFASFNSDIKKKDPNLLLSVGRFDWNKGQDILLKAMKNVIKKRPKTKLIIAGHITDLNAFKKILNLKKELRISNEVTILPDISRKKLLKLYKKASIFIMPSIIDDFGIVNLEAMAAGLPVIANDVGGISCVVKNKKTGLLVKVGNQDMLANSILFLLKNKRLREKLAKSAVEHAKQFDWNKVSKKMLKVYYSIVNQP